MCFNHLSKSHVARSAESVSSYRWTWTCRKQMMITAQPCNYTRRWMLGCAVYARENPVASSTCPCQSMSSGFREGNHGMNFEPCWSKMILTRIEPLFHV